MKSTRLSAFSPQPRLLLILSLVVHLVAPAPAFSQATGADWKELSRLRLRLAVRDGSQSQRLLALRLLSEMKDERAGELAVACLEDPDVKIRRRAAFVLGRLRQEDAVALLLERLGASRDAGVIKSILVAVGSIGDRRAAPVLRKYLGDADAGIRVNAAIALATLGAEDGLDVLLAGLESADLRAQRAATFGLGYFSDARAHEAAAAIVSDPRARWRSEAHVALARRDLVASPPAGKAAVLQRFLSHENLRVRLWSVEELAALGTREALSILRWSADESTRTGRYAALKLRFLGSDADR